MLKRITVSFTYESKGQRASDEVDFALEGKTGIGYTPEAFKSVLCQKLEEAGIVKPEVTNIDMRLGEPPMLSL